MKKKFIVLSLLFLASFCFAKEVKLNGNAEVRDRPSENGTVFASLADGTSVDVESISENSDWYEIKIGNFLNGKTIGKKENRNVVLHS